MFRDISSLGKESVIYGLSTVGPAPEFPLMPFYTHYLPAEYGVVATVFSISPS